MNKVTPIATSHIEDQAALFAHRRATIDLIGTTRARAMRAAVFGAYLFHDHPGAIKGTDAKADWRRELAEQVDDLTRISAMVNGRDPRGLVPDVICHWVNDFAELDQQRRAGFERIRDLTTDMLKTYDAGEMGLLQRALEAQLGFLRNGFFLQVTQFCDGLWGRLDNERHAEVEKAAATTEAIAKTLKRLEHIGKHVRLVSLNASVEAARVGDAGRGLGVIATEFKTLAEEIQHLANTARTDIADIAPSGGDASKLRK